MDFILEMLNEGSTIFMWVLIGIMVLGSIYLLVSGNKKRAEYYEKLKEEQAKFVVGVKVKTNAGIFGEIINIRTALDGTKVVTIKSGEGNNAMTFDIDINYITNIDDKDNKEVFDEEYNELMKKVEETSASLDAESSSKVFEEEKSENQDTEVNNEDPFAKTKNAKKSKKTNKSNKE